MRAGASPSFTGSPTDKGIAGQPVEAALKGFMDLIFEKDAIKSISLTVFDRNQTAKKLYEKLGFEIEETIQTPKLKYIMRKHR